MRNIESEDIPFVLYRAQEMKEVTTEILKNLTILIMLKLEEVKDRNRQLELVKKFHEDLMIGGLPGQKRLFSKLRQWYKWKGMSKDVAKFY